ncbi:MAG: hypothetical protein GY845_13720 [Planctomycetes bacterium]|nr:hypothetical protein [Planctomycetota bacterium]
MKKISLVILVISLLLLTSGIALAASSDDFDLSYSATSGGGNGSDKRESADYKMIDVAGQPTAIGESTSADYRMFSGFLGVLIDSSFQTPFDPMITSCNSSGEERNQFLTGQTVYVKGSGLKADTTYKLWIQNNPVAEEDDLLISEDPPDPNKTSPESVTTDSSGNFPATEIWTVQDGITYAEYDIVVDNQDGIYNSVNDGLDSASVAGFAAPVSEIASIVMMGLGLLGLGCFLWLRRRQKHTAAAI